MASILQNLHALLCARVNYFKSDYERNLERMENENKRKKEEKRIEDLKLFETFINDKVAPEILRKQKLIPFEDREQKYCFELRMEEKDNNVKKNGCICEEIEIPENLRHISHELHYTNLASILKETHFVYQNFIGFPKDKFDSYSESQ